MISLSWRWHIQQSKNTNIHFTVIQRQRWAISKIRQYLAFRVCYIIVFVCRSESVNHAIVGIFMLDNTSVLTKTPFRLVCILAGRPEQYLNSAILFLLIQKRRCELSCFSQPAWLMVTGCSRKEGRVSSGCQVPSPPLTLKWCKKDISSLDQSWTQRDGLQMGSERALPRVDKA